MQGEAEDSEDAWRLAEEAQETFCFRTLGLCANSYCVGDGSGCYMLGGWTSEWELRDE